MDSNDTEVHICDSYLVITNKDKSLLCYDRRNGEDYGGSHNHWHTDHSDDPKPSRVCMLSELMLALDVVQERQREEKEHESVD